MSSKRILVLDSDVQRRTQIRYTLSSHGYDVLEAANSTHAEAICSVDELAIDLVIRDSAPKSEFRWPSSRPPAPLVTIPPEFQVQDPPGDFFRLPFDPEQLLSQVSSALAQTETKNVVSIDEKRTGRVEGASNADKASATGKSGRLGSVLMVEDNEALRCCISATLRHHGFSVIEAGDGASAISLFTERAAEICIVLLDIELPVTSGREVFEAIEQIRPGVKVILTTAYSEATVARSIGRHRSWTFLHKPYRAVDVVRLIEAAHTKTSE
jgi:DNA-binding NtrC family response regulator